MTAGKRVYNICVGLIMIACAVLMALHPEKGYLFAVLILLVSLIADGLRQIVYYFTLARYMVDGIYILYKGLIILDFGLFAFALKDAPTVFAMLYLIGYMVFSGAIVVLRALDSKKLGAPSWKFELSHGLIQVILALLCLFFLSSVRILTFLYCLNLVHSGISRIITACRRTAIVYVGS